MEKNTIDAAHDTPPIWQYIPVTDYRVPPPTIGHTIRGGIRGFWKKFIFSPKDTSAPVQEESALRSLSHAYLDRIAPQPDWQDAVQALTEAVSDESGLRRSVTLVIGPPHSHNTDILTDLARKNGWKLYAPPPMVQVLAGDTSWIEHFRAREIPWVIPQLEKFYLRHTNGLVIVRELLRRLAEGFSDPGIIGCDSWAWSYLKYVIPEVWPEALVAQALDHDSLSRWLLQLCDVERCGTILFRESDRGTFVLPPPEGTAGSEPPFTVSRFITHLAAHSRGIPGVALTIWRMVLRATPDQGLPVGIDPNTGTRSLSTVWIPPWDRVEHPSLPKSFKAESTRVLHNLLLHGGCSDEVLLHVQPAGDIALSRVLHELEQVGIVERYQGEWRVTARGYPAVRPYLSGEGYLTDQF